jgi:stringent starvation protein B
MGGLEGGLPALCGATEAALKLPDEGPTMSPTQPLPPKKEVALALLERSSVFVHLDPRQVEVSVPASFKKQPQLVLQVGLNMPVPIPDLRLDDEGLSCTLTFSRVPFYCVVPWSSVFAMVGDDARGMVWPEDVPAEVARQVQGRGTDLTARKDPTKPALPAEGHQEEGPKDEGFKEEAPKAKRPRKRPVLAAVPDAAAVAGSKPAKASRRETRAAPLPTSPMVSPAPPSRPATAGPRKKRELPPYLRVVK